MTGDDTDKDIEDEVDTDDDTDESVLLDSSDEGFIDTVVEASLEDLVARMDMTDAEEAARRRQIRKRLEEIRELKSLDLESTFDFNLDDDL